MEGVISYLLVRRLTWIFIIFQTIEKALLISLFGEEKGSDIYTGGARDLRIEWLKEGTEFQVDEYYGSESISIRDEEDWIRA